MLDAYLNYVENYQELDDKEKKTHRAMLNSIVSELNEPTGNYSVILGLLLAENNDFSVLLSGDRTPLDDPDFKKSLATAYRKSVYAYQKRLAVICELCLDDHSLQPRFCGSFTSFDNLSCVAELMSIQFGILRRLQKSAVDRRQISKIRSCAVKLRIPLSTLLDMIDNAKPKEIGR